MENNQQELAEKPKAKQYKSLGAMIKDGAFDVFIKDFPEMQKSGDLKDLFKGEVTKFDELLFQTVKYLIVKEVQKDPVTQEEKSVDTGILKENALEALQLMLDSGANPNAYMKNGETTVLKLCEINNIEPLKLVINHKKNPGNIKHEDGIGNDALFYATMAESMVCIDFLVKELGFDVNRKNFLAKDQTALHYACGNLKESSVDKLLELGANPLLKDMYGFKPVDTLTPAYDEEVREEFSEVPEELPKYDMLYQKMLIVTKEYEEKNPIKRKVKF